MCYKYVSFVRTTSGESLDLKGFCVSVNGHRDSELHMSHIGHAALVLCSIMWLCVAQWEGHTVDSIRISGLILSETRRRPLLLLYEDCVKASSK